MEQALKEKLQEFDAKYNHFPDGRIDYSHTDAACAVILFVMYRDELLLMKRSEHVRAYQNKWDVAAGYYDEMVEPEEKAYEELKEEAGISKGDVASMQVGKMFMRHDADFGSTWFNVPILVTLNCKPNVVLDFEHTEFAWVTFDQLKNYDLSVEFSADILHYFE